MTRLSGPLHDVGGARAKLAMSWAHTAARWRDHRAREFEATYQSSIEAATVSFERALENIDREVDRALRRLPD